MPKQRSFKISLNNYTPEMIQFIENQENVQRSITRLIEDAIGRFGTGDLLQSTKIRLCPKNEVEPEVKTQHQPTGDISELLVSKLLGIERTATAPLTKNSEEEQVVHKESKRNVAKKVSTSKPEVNEMVFDATAEMNDTFSIEDTESETILDEVQDGAVIKGSEDDNSEDEADIILELEGDNTEDNKDNFDHSIWDD